MGIKLNALGVSCALIFSHYLSVLFPVGVILSIIGLVLIFFDK